MARRIVEQLADEPPRVVEIGPGRGALTGWLLDRFERVVALEVDAGLLRPLEERFAGRALDLHHADALTEELEPLLGGERPWQLAANLPYSVGTPILRRLLPRHDLFTRLVVMLQREVAVRLVAPPGHREHGLLALERAAWAEARIAFDVGPRAFRPRPRVVSSVVVVDLRPPAVPPGELPGALRLAAHALRRPRKMLRSAVRPLASEQALEEAGLDPQARPGTVSLEGWLRLARVTGRSSAV